MCPLTMCPPNRPSAFIARSRFTSQPDFKPPRLVRLKLSGVTSAVKLSELFEVTVRQVPFTATLSPKTKELAKEHFMFKTREEELINKMKENFNESLTKVINNITEIKDEINNRPNYS